MEFYHLETETYISPTLIKCLNFIYYDSLRNPISEINFDSSKGVGRFLSRMIKDYVSNTDINTNNLVDIEFTNDLLTNVNTKLEKIKSFKDHAIKAVLEGDVSLLFPKLISLQDARGGALSKCGYGIQFLLLVTLSILNKLQTISDQRGETGVFVNEDTGERSISVVLGLDEPEIHLHPYMQRSLIKYLNKVINNEDSDLKLLIKELFGIDKLRSQIQYQTPKIYTVLPIDTLQGTQVKDGFLKISTIRRRVSLDMSRTTASDFYASVNLGLCFCRSETEPPHLQRTLLGPILPQRVIIVRKYGLNKVYYLMKSPERRSRITK